MKTALALENTNSVIQRQKITAHILTSLLGGIPRPLGTIMRKFLYKTIFAHMGRNVYIQAGSEFLGANAIEIGNDVKIMRDVRLNVKATNSCYSLGQQSLSGSRC